MKPKAANEAKELKKKVQDEVINEYIPQFFAPKDNRI